MPEQVTRFVFDAKHLLANGAKWKAFEPSRLDNKTSVFVIDELTTAEIWELGNHTRPGLSPIAHAALKPSGIESAGLQLEVDNDPLRHAAIGGWPSEKEQVRQLAQLLAANAILERREQV